MPPAINRNSRCFVSWAAFGRAARCHEGFAERSEVVGVDAGEDRRLAWAVTAVG